MRIFFLFLVLLIWGFAEGQITDRLYFHHLTQSEGLSQTTNYYIYKDSYGFMWLSSINGLNRYDGREIRVYKYQIGEPTSLPDNNIQSKFIEDKDGNLWFTTYDGLVFYDRIHDHFKNYQFEKDSTALKGYYLIQENRGRNLGVIIEGKYFRFFDIYEKEWLNDTPLDTFTINTQRVLPLFDTNDSIEGLISYNFDVPGLHFHYFNEQGDKDHLVEFSGETNEELVLHCENILRLGDTIIIAADEGFLIYSLNDSEWQFKPTTNWSPNRIVSFKNDEILVSTNGGGWKVTDLQNILSGKHILHKPNDPWSLSSNNINGIYTFDDGTIWVSAIGNGVDFTQPKKIKFKMLDMAQHFGFVDRAFNVVTMVENSDGYIWCASRGGGVFVLSPSLQPINHFNTSYQGDEKLFNNDVFHIFFDNENRCWVFTYSGFGVIEKKNRGFEYTAIEEEVFLYGTKLQDGRILFSSLHGVYQFKETTNSYKFELVTQIDTISAYTHLFQNRSELLFLDKDISSILILDPTNDFKPVTEELLIKGEVTCYYEEPNSNIIWIATKNGLVRLDPDDDWHWDIFTEADGLPDQQIYAVLGDDNGALWLTTNRGMVRFFPEDERFQVFSMYDGLQGLEYSTFSHMKRSNGEFWFGGVNGINYFDPNKVQNLQVNPNPTITSIEINNDPSPGYLEDAKTKATNVSLINNLFLNYDQNDLSIGIAALEYSDPTSNEYFFQMVGNEDTIVRRGKKNTFEYPNMQAGTYTLTYNASNSDGVWFDDRVKQLEIVINPPWWETWWARTLFALVGLSLIYVYYRYRIAQIRKEEEFKRKEAEFKQKEAEYKQLVAETETAVLRLQMNPHFIFNSMNSINSYILQKDVDTASDYLHRFARLMRMILKFAAKPLIAISDEIELLDLYLQTEAMRFEKKFEYSFDLKDDLDPDEFVIPTMILQPFVENAIWHGISNKKDGEGKIKISFWQENESFLCSVQDNGVGRIASKQISQKAKTHESKALSITEHRLQLLEKKNGVSASFEIQDLEDAAQKPTGTKVILKFPLL